MSKIILFSILLFGLKINAQNSDFRNINFEKADQIAMLNKGKNMSNLYLLTNNLVRDLKTDVEKFRVIYKWVCDNVENDYKNNVISDKKRAKIGADSLKLNQWNREFSQKVFRKMVLEKKTICTGYAYLIKEMANLAGISCEIVDGYGRTAESNIGKQTPPNHSWNAVKLNNKWYLCDATWSSGCYYVDLEKFIFDFNDGYFLSNPDLFIRDHYPLNEKWALIDAVPSINMFLNGPLIYNRTHNFEIIPISPTTMYFSVFKNTEVVFVIKSSKPIADGDVQIEQIYGDNRHLYPVKIAPLANGIYEIRSFFNSFGKYDTHLKIKNEIVLSYVVSVLKSK
jgi:Transglutaminase-like superfamily